MKLREEGASARQVKRVAGYRGETATSDASLPTSNNNTPQPRLTTDDALAYLKAVKDMIKDDKDKGGPGASAPQASEAAGGI
ncbi:hypothetical protein AXG93_472s1000 [Marchantia polymorpha subsp. ruderalis]|uniref:Uncharacterized protein n=1 Tax=Marchantia polymorpha subsp. ruderalis TaxID=1480154 RepID=A0A176WD51_MARPO|nr:hypothetical protein AXG93_472s1000 [Marchantia polymorpha subsp. ruderalis]